MKRGIFTLFVLFLVNVKVFSLNAFRSDSVKITVPNVFTPNGDGINDTWSMIIVNGKEVFDLQTTIYNRFGKRVFESTNVRQVWNGFNQYEGTLCSDGSYFYVISYLDANTNETKTLKGFIELFGNK
jgi:gliding motility-associated-like protein